MRISMLLALILPFSQNRDLFEKKQGICSTYPSKCPQSKQLSGICCRNSLGAPTYFNNFCLACQSGCDSFVYKVKDDGQCEEQDL